jgi:two-component system, NarL family, invasion response regulator UvrY
MLESNSEQFPVKVVISTDDGKEAIKLAASNPIDLAIVDISMPQLDGIECTSRLNQRFPELPILVLSMHEEYQYAMHALESGASGYLTKQSAAQDLMIAINALYNGRKYLPESIKNEIALASVNKKKSPDLLSNLSKREFQVMVNLINGRTNREIAEMYNLSIKTIDTYRSRILQKLEVRNNVELTRFAADNGIIQPNQ